jgi:CheY-like chemotaxis protein
MKLSTILLIEDDPSQSRTIERELHDRFGADVRCFDTELAFRKYLKTSPPEPDLIISDASLLWTHPAEENESDAEEAPGRPREAGARCFKVARAHPATKEVPWIYMSAWDKDTIKYEENKDFRTRYVPKTGSAEPLLSEIEEFLQSQDGWDENEKKLTEDLVQNPKTKAVLLEGMETDISECVPWEVVKNSGLPPLVTRG